MIRETLLATACVGIGLAACTTATTTASPTPPTSLADTRWRLVQFQSSDDAQGVLKPDDPAKYEVTFGPGGSVTMRLDCNRGAGRWTATPSSAGRGGLVFSPMVMTRAACLPGSMDTKIAADMTYVRSYVVEGDELHLALMADGGIYTWKFVERTGGAPGRRAAS